MKKLLTVPECELKDNQIMIDSIELYESIKGVVKIQKKFSKLPILNYALLDFQLGRARILATNLNEHYEGNCHYYSNGVRFSTCVPCFTIRKEWGKVNRTYVYRPFIDYIKLMAEYKEWLIMEFYEKTQTLTVFSGDKFKSKTQFKCLDAQEFPSVSL